MDQNIKSSSALIKRIGACLVVVGAIAPVPAMATPAQATSTVQEALVITNSQSLDFGTIIPGSIVSVLQLDQSTGAITVLRGDALPAGGTPSPAKLSVSGAPLTRVRIDPPAGAIDLTRQGGTETMRVNNFTLTGARNRILPLTGTLPFQIGGRLRVLPNQAAGTYAGNFDVTVNFR